MSMRKKGLVALSGLLALFAVLLVALPWMFRDDIAARVRTEIDGAVQARVGWSGIGLTFVRNFPNLTLALDDLTVVGVDAFEGDTLLAVRDFRLVLDVGSVFRAWRGTGPVVVRSVRLHEPDVRLKVLADGRANWDLAGADPDATAAEGTPSSVVDVTLRDVEVTGGTLLLENAQTGLFASVVGLRHTLEGDFSRDRLVVQTRTRAGSATVRFAGVPYLADVAVDFTAAVDADMANRTFTFADNELRLNDLLLRFAGSAQAGEDRIALDMTFEAPQGEFSQILSLVPVVYANDFRELETSGSFSVAGHVRGDWGENAFPSFALNAQVADGMFRYPDLPLPARDIGLALAVDNPGGDVDLTVLRVDRFHVRVGEQPVDATLTLRTPVSDPDVAFSVRGTMDLADLPRTLKLDDIEELKGTLRADASMRARLSDMDAARYERVEAQGSMAARDVVVRSAALPQPVSVQEATVALSPRRVEVRSLQMQLGSSDVQATGSLDNVLGFLLQGEDLRGRATFASRYVALDEWRSDDSELRLIPVPAGVDLALSGTVDRLSFGGLEMVNARGGLQVKDRRVNLDDFALGTLGGRVAVNGFYETSDPGRPTFGVDLAMDSLDIPSAARALLTVRTLAPVASFARGAFTANMSLAGALGQNMEPLLDVLDGGGSLFTTSVALEGFPALVRLADVMSLPQLSSPTLRAIRSSVEIRGGRLHVKPFRVGVGDFRMGVAGSNGIDQSLDYALSLELPRAALGAGAQQAVQALVTKAGRAGLDLQAADTVTVSVGLSGTVTAPSIQTDFGGLVASATDRARQAADQAVEQRIDAAEARVDSAADALRRRSQARADSIVQAAEERAAAIRAEARRLADEVRAEAERRAEQVVSEATNPVARVAARAVADRIKKEADEKATAAVAEADRRADDLVAEARSRAEELLRGGG